MKRQQRSGSRSAPAALINGFPFGRLLQTVNAWNLLSNSSRPLLSQRRPASAPAPTRTSRGPSSFMMMPASIVLPSPLRLGQQRPPHFSRSAAADLQLVLVVLDGDLVQADEAVEAAAQAAPRPATNW